MQVARAGRGLVRCPVFFFLFFFPGVPLHAILGVSSFWGGTPQQNCVVVLLVLSLQRQKRGTLAKDTPNFQKGGADSCCCLFFVLRVFFSPERFVANLLAEFGKVSGHSSFAAPSSWS